MIGLFMIKFSAILNKFVRVVALKVCLLGLQLLGLWMFPGTNLTCKVVFMFEKGFPCFSMNLVDTGSLLTMEKLNNKRKLFLGDFLCEMILFFWYLNLIKSFRWISQIKTSLKLIWNVYQSFPLKSCQNHPIFLKSVLIDPLELHKSSKFLYSKG